MTVGEVIVYLVIALLCGIFGQILAGRLIGGKIVSTLVGLVGAVLGAYIARSLNAPEPFPVTIGDKSIPIIWAIIGATLVVYVVASIQRASSRPR